MTSVPSTTCGDRRFGIRVLRSSRFRRGLPPEPGRACRSRLRRRATRSSRSSSSLAALQITLDLLPSLILERVRGLESVAGIRPESASLAPFPHHHSAARCRRVDSFLRTRFRGPGGRGRPSSAHIPSHESSARSSRAPGHIHPADWMGFRFIQSEVMLLA